MAGVRFIGGPLDGQHHDTPRRPWLIDTEAGWAYQWVEGAWHYAGRPCECGAIVRLGPACALCGSELTDAMPDVRR